MLNLLVRFSLTQRLFVCVLAALVVGLGVRAWLLLPVDAYPDISPTQVKVILKVPGMTAEEIEQRVTYPVETELLGIPRQAMLRSTTKYAITSITLDFIEGTDIYWARQQVNERLGGLLSNLPFAVEGGLAPMSTPLSEMFMFTVENAELSLMEKRRLLQWEIRPALRTVDGVADVNVLGGYARTFQVTPRTAELSALGLGMDDIKTAIVGQNMNAGTGRILLGNDVLVVRVEGRITSLKALGDVVVKAGQQGVYRLRDVADVEIGHLARYGAVTRNGEEAVQGLVISLRDSNTGAVVAGVKERLAELENTLPPGTDINVFYDRARLISTAIGTMSNALIQAIVLVVAVLAVFLGNLRAALVVSLSLPLAALATFLLMTATQLTANLMSLGGLVIAIGLLVDASVVVVENTVTRLADDRGLPRLHLIYRAVREVALPVLSGTLIVIIVFSPLLTLSWSGRQDVHAGGPDHCLCHGRGTADSADRDSRDGIFAAGRERHCNATIHAAYAGLVRRGARRRAGALALAVAGCCRSAGAERAAAGIDRQDLHAGPGRGRCDRAAGEVAEHLARGVRRAGQADRERTAGGDPGNPADCLAHRLGRTGT